MFFNSLESIADNKSFTSFFNANRYAILKNLYEEDKKKTTLPIKIQILEENVYKNKVDLLEQIKKLDCKKEHTEYYESLLSLLLSNSLDEGGFQQGLEKINERSCIQKKNGVYYTPEDVSSFILTNSVRLVLEDDNCGLKTETEFLLESHIFNNKTCNIKDQIIKYTILDPTCGTGAFLIKAFDFKVSLIEKVCGCLSDTDIIKIVGSLFGNDIDSFSTYITQTRLLFKAINLSRSIDVPKLLNTLLHNFYNYDFLCDYQKINRKFDFIIGNPPYVEKSQLSGTVKSKYGNIYADVIDNSFSLLKDKGVMGYIIPISYISTPRFSELRAVVQKNTSKEYVLSYADRPDCLFVGVHQKLNILIAQKCKSNEHTTYTSDYDYWYTSERSRLFLDTSFIKNSFVTDAFYPKIGTACEEQIYRKILQQPLNILDRMCGNTKVYLNMRATFWIKSFIDIPYKSNEYKELCFDELTAHFVNVILNSSLFWWFWVKVSDCWHITRKELSLFKIPLLSKEELEMSKELSLKINRALESTKERVDTKQTLFEYKHKKCKSIIDELDDFLAQLYGLSENELKYIKSYKEQYRLGMGSS